MKLPCVTINPSITFRFATRNAQEIQIVAGEGSRRVEFATDNHTLVSWLLKLRFPCTPDEAIQKAVSILGINIESAMEMVNSLVESSIILPCPAHGIETLTSELQWEKWGWRDALDFHRATRDLLWRHDYSSKPEIMTWYLGNKAIPCDIPKPSPKKQKAEWPEVKLPAPSEKLDAVSFGTALDKRQTFRHFAVKAIPLQDFSDLLAWSFGVTGEKSGKQFRATPTYSLGNHFSVYPVVVNVEGLLPGAYYYSSDKHALYQIREGGFGNELIEFAQNRDFMKNVSCGIFYTVHWEQYMWKYRFSRAYRLALFEMAGVVQICLLCAAALDLKTFLTPAITDSKVAALLNIENQLLESPLYVTGIGLA